MFQVVKRDHKVQRPGSLPVPADFEEAGAEISARLAERNFSVGFEGFGPAVTSVLARARNSAWRDPDLKRQAIASVEGIALAVDNGLAKQAQLHLRELSHVCNVNTACNAVRILSQEDASAKPFAVCERAAKVLEVEGPGYDWRLISVAHAEEIVPAEYLAQLSRLRHEGIVPDSVYVAVPYAPEKEPMSLVLADELENLVTMTVAPLAIVGSGLRSALTASRGESKLPDPLLLAGFGTEPVTFVELGRWI